MKTKTHLTKLSHLFSVIERVQTEATIIFFQVEKDTIIYWNSNIVYKNTNGDSYSRLPNDVDKVVRLFCHDIVAQTKIIE
jgi:hypothetical protein